MSNMAVTFTGRHDGVTPESGNTNICAKKLTLNEDSIKKIYMRSASSFCDEMFLDEHLKKSTSVELADNFEEDAEYCGDISIGTLNNGGGSVNSSECSVMTGDTEIFKYHSRLSMTLSCIINEPNCLSFFVQYLENKNALPLIKLYLDTQNFKNAALADLRNQQKHNSNTHDTTPVDLKKYGDISGDQIYEYEEDCSSDLPTLKTLCDLSMRKSITDDEKSKIYAETNKQLYKRIIENPKKTLSTSTVSLCSVQSGYTSVSDSHDGKEICESSVKDALAIYQKYLIRDAPLYVKIPVDIISRISLILCQKSAEETKISESHTITADCFVEAQHFVLDKLEKQFLNDFLQSNYYCKYCIELVESEDITIYDILYSEVTLFYFMEYLEQQNERHCLDFWSAAINFRKGYVPEGTRNHIYNEVEARSDAMIIYEKFFSLQLDSALWVSNKLRAYVESTICSEQWVCYCFDLPLKMAAIYMERKFLKTFLKSTLFDNYVNELKTRLDAKEEIIKDTTQKIIEKVPIRRCVSVKTNRHRKTLSDCTFDKKCFISQQNTLLASMDGPSTAKSNLKQFKLDIDSNQLINPNLLWQRSHGKGLKFGRVNCFGRYERDFVSASDVNHNSVIKNSHNWLLPRNGYKLKSALRKFVNLPQDNVQEEIAWQVAEMIVKDITDVTMNGRTKEVRTNCCDNKSHL